MGKCLFLILTLSLMLIGRAAPAAESRTPISFPEALSQARQGAYFSGLPRMWRRWQPMGVCAQGLWRITGSNPHSGLFSPGVTVPVLLRFAIADNQAMYSGAETHKITIPLLLPSGRLDFPIPLPSVPFRLPRMAGITLWFFPGEGAASDSVAVPLRLDLLDEWGFDGSKRKSFLGDDNTGNPVRFVNRANADGPGAKILRGFVRSSGLTRFSFSLAPLAMAGPSGILEAGGHAPNGLELSARQSIGIWRPAYDFRDQLLDYPEQELVFSIHEAGSNEIGELTVERPFASVGCDSPGLLDSFR